MHWAVPGRCAGLQAAAVACTQAARSPHTYPGHGWSISLRTCQPRHHLPLQRLQRRGGAGGDRVGYMRVWMRTLPMLPAAQLDALHRAVHAEQLLQLHRCFGPLQQTRHKDDRGGSARCKGNAGEPPRDCCRCSAWPGGGGSFRCTCCRRCRCRGGRCIIAFQTLHLHSQIMHLCLRRRGTRFRHCQPSLRCHGSLHLRRHGSLRLRRHDTRFCCCNPSLQRNSMRVCCCCHECLGLHLHFSTPPVDTRLGYCCLYLCRLCCRGRHTAACACAAAPLASAASRRSCWFDSITCPVPRHDLRVHHASSRTRALFLAAAYRQLKAAVASGGATPAAAAVEEVRPRPTRRRPVPPSLLSVRTKGAAPRLEVEKGGGSSSSCPRAPSAVHARVIGIPIGC